MFSQKSIGAKFRAEGYTPKKPVLIIPGLCSSCLKVVESPYSDWVGKRIWLSMSSIGFDKVWDPLGFGRKKKKGEETKMAEVDAAAKRKWISHMVLQNDGISDPEGIKLRPVKGLKGCAYLDPGAITNALSYVFGPFIETLEDAGYIDEVNLNAVPYDWRLPPHRLEERDGYFSEVQRIIEKMVRENGSKVAVICHSLGNRVMHYFCKFMEKKVGRQWVTDHVDCWIALGPLWLGAPKLLRAIVTGDRMGLDAFLFPEEGIALGRSLGSSAWMFPYITHENEFQSYCQLRNKKSKKYETKSNQEILTEGGAEIVWKKYYDYYHMHHLVGPPEEVFKPPPIDKIYAIYGINLKTETYYFFKQSKTKNSVTPLQLDPEGSVQNLKCEGGIGFETKNTRQNVLKGKPRSGDGTVPYASLSYCKKWSKDVQVKVVEIEGAEHREILKNKTMITLVLEYVMQAPPPSVLPSNYPEISYEVNIQAKNKFCPRILYLGRENMCTLTKSGSKTKGKHFYENITDVRLQTDGKGFIIEFENCPPYAFKTPNSEGIVSDIAARCRFIQEAKKTYTEDRNEFGQTALHIAAMDNSIDDIIALLKSGSDVNAADNNGWTPLITAADKGNLEAILCLLQTNDIDVGRQTINNVSAIHKMVSINIPSDNEALKRKWSGVMRILKSKGVNLNEKSEMGELPIHIAVKRSNLVAITWLGENGANINAANNVGETPLHYAIRAKNEEVMLRLCSMGANKHAETSQGETALNMARKISPDLFSKLQNQNQPIQRFSSATNLLSTSADVDEYGQTPLHRAAFEDRLDDVFEIVSSDITNINAQDKNGWTPLHSAASNGNLEVVVVLLNMPSADVTISTHNNTTILHYLIRKKFEGPKLSSYIDTLNRMKEKGCNVDAQASKGVTPLHEACIKNNISGIEWLLNNGADVNLSTISGDTPLHFAVRSGSKEAIVMLLKFGANPHAVSQYDGTPIDLAKSIAPHLVETLSTQIRQAPRKSVIPQKKNIFRATVINTDLSNYNFNQEEESFEKVLNDDENEIYGKEEDDDDEEVEVQLPRGRRGTVINDDVTRARTDTVSIFQKPNFSNQKRNAPPPPTRGGPPLPQYNRTSTNSPPTPQFNNNVNRGGPPIPQFNNSNNNNVQVNHNRPIPQEVQRVAPPPPARGTPPPNRPGPPVRTGSLQDFSHELNTQPPQPPQRSNSIQRPPQNQNLGGCNNQSFDNVPNSRPDPQRGVGPRRGNLVVDNSNGEKRITPPRISDPNDGSVPNIAPRGRVPSPNVDDSRQYPPNRGRGHQVPHDLPRSDTPHPVRGMPPRRGGLSQSFDQSPIRNDNLQHPPKRGMAPVSPNNHNSFEERNGPPTRGRSDPNIRGGLPPRGGGLPPRAASVNANLLNNALNIDDFPRPNPKRISQGRPKLQAPGYSPPSPDEEH